MTQTEFLEWFGRWKDVVTTTAAVVAIIVVVCQILQAGRFERNRLRREQVAARATLPLTLNALSNYGRDMLIALAPLERWLQGNRDGKMPMFNQPQMPLETIHAVEKVIAAYQKDSVARALAALMSEVQVLDARTSNFSGNEENVRSWGASMSYNLIMAAGIVARCHDMFEFARKETEFGEPKRRAVQQVLRSEQISEPLYPLVWRNTGSFEDDPEPSWWERRKLRKIAGLFKNL